MKIELFPIVIRSSRLRAARKLGLLPRPSALRRFLHRFRRNFVKKEV